MCQWSKGIFIQISISGGSNPLCWKYFIILKDFLATWNLHLKNNTDLGRVNSGMLCEQVLSCVGFTAFVALERLLPRVRHHVLLQITRLSASIVALVWLHLKGVSPVCFAIMWIFNTFLVMLENCCASVWLFPRGVYFVLLQIAWCYCSIIALIALVWFLSSVSPNVHS